MCRISKQVDQDLVMQKNEVLVIFCVPALPIKRSSPRSQKEDLGGLCSPNVSGLPVCPYVKKGEPMSPEGFEPSKR
jgi:hypothetical protein